MRNDDEIVTLIDEIERLVATRQKEMSAKQTFDGTLRIFADKVYIGKGEGKRALEELKLSIGNRLHFAK